MIHQPSSRRENYRHKDNKDKSPMDSLETELSDAKKAVRDLALKIEESNSRAKGLQRTPKWCQKEQPETSIKNEDARYEKVMKELEHIKQELTKLKLDMARVLKEKRHAEKSSKASNSKASTLSASIGLIKKEIQELNEEQTLVEFARIEAAKESESIESQRKEDNETNRELQITLSHINLIQSELQTARKQDMSPISTINDELECAKRELASIKGEGFKFMTSMDVIRDELKHVRDEKARLQKAEQKRDLTVQNLNSKILRARAKLESLTAAETKTNIVVLNLVITLDQLREELQTSHKEKDVIDKEIENTNAEIDAIESEIEVAEEKLEAAMEELKTIKSSESKAMGNLRDLIDTTIEARDTASMNSSTITITNFEYEYLTEKASGAAELADNKIAAARAWVEALKANEREILMKVEMIQREIGDLSIEVDGDGLELEGKDVVLPRRSVYRVKRARLQNLRSPAAARYSRKSGFLKREKVVRKLKKVFSNKNIGTV